MNKKITKEQIKKNEEEHPEFWQGYSDSFYKWNKTIDRRIEELERISGILELRKLKKEMNK